MTNVLLTYRLVNSHANAISTVHRGILAAWPQDTNIHIQVFVSPDEPLKASSTIHFLHARSIVSQLWLCARLFKKTDVAWYIAGDPKALLLFWIAKICNPKLRWMCTVHGSYTVRKNESAAHGPINYALAFFSLFFGIKAVINKTHKIVCISRYVQGDFMKYFPAIPADRFAVIPNGVESSSIEESNFQKDLSVYGFKKPQPTMVFVGRAANHKRIPLIFKIAEQLPQINFVVVTTAILPGCLETRNIKYRIHASADQIITIYKNADGFIFPSLDEGFGLVVIEAMSKSIPVIATKHGGVQEIINSQENGFLIPHDPQELKGFCNAILRITEDSALQAEVGRAGAQTVRNHYVWPTIAQQYLHLINMLQ